MRYRLVNPFLESADMKGRQETLWTEMAKVRVDAARIRAELDDIHGLDGSAFKDIPLAAGQVRLFDSTAWSRASAYR